MTHSKMKIELVSDLTSIDKDQWNKLNKTNHPFTSYEFLTALELSKFCMSKYRLDS